MNATPIHAEMEVLVSMVSIAMLVPVYQDGRDHCVKQVRKAELIFKFRSSVDEK